MSTLPLTRCTRKWSLAGILLLLAALGDIGAATAQSFESGEGVVRVTDWPDEEARRTLRYDILPFIDTLTVAYQYAVRDGRPALSLVVDWDPGTSAIYRGVRTSYAEIPGDVRMVGLDLRIGVFVDGRRAAVLSVVVDSMVVGPYPDFVEIALPDLTWDNVFAETTPEEAKAIFLNGFELADLEVAGAGFAVFDEDGDVTNPAAGRPTRSQPSRVSIYRAPRFVDGFIDVTWLIGGISRVPSPREDIPRGSMGRGDGGRNAEEARGDRRARPGDGTVGRDAGRSEARGRNRSDARDEERSGTRSADRPAARGEDRPRARAESSTDDDEKGGSEDRKEGGFRLPGSGGDDDDDEDDDELVPYALAAVGAAGILAAVGGTVGYYGNSHYAPIGLTSGFVRRDGGLLLQAAVNEALLFDEPRAKRLTVKLLSFGNFLNSGLQPALGAGVLATAEGGEITYEPTLSIGAVGVYKMMLVYGGYDVVHQGPEFGVAVNFREFGWGRSNRGE